MDRIKKQFLIVLLLTFVTFNGYSQDDIVKDLTKYKKESNIALDALIAKYSSMVEPPIEIPQIEIPPIDIEDLKYKFSGWWINGIDQLGATDLVNTVDGLKMPYFRDLKTATDVISLNNWFDNTIPITILKTDISSYCASRQFYNSINNELIIIKINEHLTSEEERGLLAYLEINDISHTYDNLTIDLFSRFTNIYSDSEKSRIDNVMRLLKKSGVYSRLDHFYLNATSGKEEQLLDWKGTSDITISSDNVVVNSYRGLAPQTGYFSTNAIIANDKNIKVDNAFVSCKLYSDFEIQQRNYIFGADNDKNFRYRPTVAGWTSVKSYESRMFTTYPIYYFLKDSKYSDTNVMNSLGGTFTSHRNGILKHTVAMRDNINVLPTTEILIGGKIAEGYQSNKNNLQHLAWGSSLTDEQSSLLSLIIDNFCYGQTELDTDYIQAENNVKVYTYDFDIKDAIGENCIYQTWDNIVYSEDLGKSITSLIPFNFAEYGGIEMCHIFDNGKVLFATEKNQVFTTTIELKSFTEITPTKNGKPYPIHTPKSHWYPGTYYKYLGINNKQYLEDGREIIVWGNYGNGWNGANPTVNWYSFGDEIKVAYEYGQSPYLTDGGHHYPEIGGNLLGDPNSDILPIHSHGIQQRPDNKNKFFSMHGDFDRVGSVGSFFETMWVEMTYNPTLDSWVVEKVLEGSQTTRVKATAGQMPDDGYVYWCSDLTVKDTVAQLPDIGYFRAKYDELGDLTKHEKVYENKQLHRSLNHFHLDSSNFLMGGGYAGGGQSFGLFGDADIIFSPNVHDVEKYIEMVLPIAGNSYFYKITKISDKKYLLNGMMTYTYNDSFSIVLDFN